MEMEVVVVAAVVVVGGGEQGGSGVRSNCQSQSGGGE